MAKFKGLMIKNQKILLFTG